MTARALPAPASLTTALAAIAVLLVVSCGGSGSGGLLDGGASAGDTSAIAADRPATTSDSVVDDVNPGPTPPGSSACGPNGATCDPASAASCQYCDGAATPWRCTCDARRVWDCSVIDGHCGVVCGDRRCLPHELCQQIDDGCGTPSCTAAPARSICQPIPAACGDGQPSCACAAPSLAYCNAAYVCTCSDVGTAAATLKCHCSAP
jgi:hypothetical protein